MIEAEPGRAVATYFATRTSDALTTASTSSPTLSAKSSMASYCRPRIDLFLRRNIIPFSVVMKLARAARNEQRGQLRLRAFRPTPHPLFGGTLTHRSRLQCHPRRKLQCHPGAGSSVIPARAPVSSPAQAPVSSPAQAGDPRLAVPNSKNRRPSAHRPAPIMHRQGRHRKSRMN